MEWCSKSFDGFVVFIKILKCYTFIPHGKNNQLKDGDLAVKFFKKKKKKGAFACFLRSIKKINITI